MNNSPSKRNTKQRKALEQVFMLTDRPLSLEEVLENGKKVVPSINLATVYRNLKIMVEEGWLVKVNIPSSATLFERGDKGHHHYFHCNTCNRAFELPHCALKEGSIPTPVGFVVESHEVILYGFCPTCSGAHGPQP